jgi:hypothetical protein
MVAQACNSNYWGGGDQEDSDLRFPSPDLNQWLVTCTCHLSYEGKYKEEDNGPNQPRHKARPYFQNYQSKKGWQSSQVRVFA